jgi:CubicO group peptidase (beta-lactamase class C family)
MSSKGAEGLEQIDTWPATAAAAWASRSQWTGRGPLAERFRWASVTKVLTAMALWVATEEGTLSLGDPAGPEGSSLAHLLAHASGLAPDSDRVLAAPGKRRIYSNRGFEVAAALLEDRAQMPFGDYLRQGVLEPLGMFSTRLEGSPAHGAVGPVQDLLLLGLELMRPRLVGAAMASLVRSVAFPGLAGVLPGFGRYDPNDWGLGVEIRGHKRPHWTGSLNSPATFGHFGQMGGFLWVDPEAQVTLVSLSDRPFGPWAARAWPALADAVLEQAAG